MPDASPDTDKVEARLLLVEDTLDIKFYRFVSAAQRASHHLIFTDCVHCHFSISRRNPDGAPAPSGNVNRLQTGLN
jgi:hypothetical protein